MIDAHAWIAFAIASFLIVIVPGPTVTVVIANSLRAGTRAGLLNVLGTQLGVMTMIAILAAGLDTVVSLVGEAFVVLKVVGALYLIWLGIKLWRADGSLGEAGAAVKARSAAGYVWQGFVVIWSNPKALFLFGAFIPQFVSNAGNPATQTVMLGATFVVVATICDSIYAFAAGRTGGWMNRRNIRLLERVSGSFLIGGGLWMLAARRTVSA